MGVDWPTPSLTQPERILIPARNQPKTEGDTLVNPQKTQESRSRLSVLKTGTITGPACASM